MKILITGGLGFIGSSTAIALAEDKGSRITLLDNQSEQVHGANPTADARLTSLDNVEILKGDIRDRNLVLAALNNVDAVVHLAAETGTAQSMYRMAHYSDVNVTGTGILLDCLANEKHAVKKVIIASSRSIYGEGDYQCEKDGIVHPQARSGAHLSLGKWNPRCPICGGDIVPVPTAEDSPIRPESIYAMTKYAQEQMVRISCGALGIGYTVLRFQNVYGAGQSLNNPYTGILSIFSTRIRRGLTLPIYEDGLESRDFVHVSDVVSAIDLSLRKPQADGCIFNVGSGVGTSVMDIANMLADTFESTTRPVVTGQYRLGDIRHCYADISRISEKLGYAPKMSLKDGLSEFAEWVMREPIGQDGLEKANAELKARKLMA